MATARFVERLGVAVVFFLLLGRFGDFLRRAAAFFALLGKVDVPLAVLRRLLRLTAMMELLWYEFRYSTLPRYLFSLNVFEMFCEKFHKQFVVIE